MAAERVTRVTAPATAPGRRHLPLVEASVGKLLHFDKSRRVAGAPAGRSGPGRVVLFTGVRYERTPAGDAPPESSGGSGSQKRQRG